MTVPDATITGAIGSIAVFCVYLTRRALTKADEEAKRAREIQDKSMDRYEKQTEALSSVQAAIAAHTHTLAAVAESLAEHDRANGKAHRESSEILKQVAETQAVTCETIKRVAGNVKT